MALIKMVKGEWESPWTIVETLRRIRGWLKDYMITVQHIHGEENSLVYFSLTIVSIFQAQNIDFLYRTN